MPADMKAIIAQAFKELAQQKNIDKITVKSLIESCGISRQTFYYYFQDIMDVISWSLHQVSEETLARSIKAGTPREALRLLISDVSENRSMIIRLLDSQRRSEIEALFVRTARGSLQEILRQRPVTLPFPYTNLETALDFWAFGITGLLLSRCLKGPVDADLLAGQILLLIPEELSSPDSQISSSRI